MEGLREISDKVKVTNEGLMIPGALLKKTGLTNDVDVLTRDHLILIKPKSFTTEVKGIIKDSKLSREELDELYLESKAR
ncbi:hypothetical protein KJ693_10980 [bacterium]|nr:hypothetical protein [bacterium]MBU1615813.1 hypothetical protein [bacterium]